jgi:hypothetical protein
VRGARRVRERRLAYRLLRRRVTASWPLKGKSRCARHVARVPRLLAVSCRRRRSGRASSLTMTTLGRLPRILPAGGRAPRRRSHAAPASA